LSDVYHLDRKQLAVLLISILIVALCGIAYELIIGTVSSYLLGNSVYQFSLTIGLFMFAMGIGSYLSKLFVKELIFNFIVVELIVALVGGISSLLLFVVFPFAAAIYTLVMYALILITGSLVGLEIPLLTRILSQKESIRESIANVLSLDYVGALLGSVLFPLFLLPQLGLMRSSFAVGLINAATAVVNIHYFRKQIKRPALLGTLSVLTMVLLLGLIVAGTRLTTYAENRLYFDQVIYKKQTPYQRIVYTRSTFTGEQRLYIDGHIQYSDRDEYRYHESLVHPVMAPEGPRRQVLVLGGGDGLAVREILKYKKVESIDLVDIDPEITRFSRDFPPIAHLNNNSLADPKVHVHNTDAFAFVNRPGKHYDRVIIDLPDPHNEALNKLYSREFYKLVRLRMNPGGFLVTQSASPFYTRQTFWCIENTLRHAGFHTRPYHTTVPAFGIWGFHLASPSGPIPYRFQFRVPTRYMDRRVMETASFFGKDMDRMPVPVNTLMEPKLYPLYLRELSDGPS
jgi:spermidine synthase